MNIETIKFLNQLKNASLVNHESIKVDSNKLIKNLLKLLYKEGYILYYRIKKKESFYNSTTESIVNLRYFYNKSIFKNLKIISSPSNKRYFSLINISRMISKKNLFVFSTNKGLLTLNECKKLRVGGVLLFVC
jgi:small subunit ribosomal protein S8